MIDKLGSPDTYNHYPTGWAVAFSTPYRMFKRYSQYVGGTADPLSSTGPTALRAVLRCGTSTTTAPTSCRPFSNAAV